MTIDQIRIALGLGVMALLGLASTAAQAETDWGAYKTFVGTKCESKKTIADIRDSIKGLTFDDGGGSTFGTASRIDILASKTIRATAGQLVCQLTFRTIEGGDTYKYSARHTVWIKPDGSWRTQFLPNQ